MVTLRDTVEPVKVCVCLCASVCVCVCMCVCMCQAMLDTTQKWLNWSLLKQIAKVPKCTAMFICGQTGKCTGENLLPRKQQLDLLYGSTGQYHTLSTIKV